MQECPDLIKKILVICIQLKLQKAFPPYCDSTNFGIFFSTMSR